MNEGPESQKRVLRFEAREQLDEKANMRTRLDEGIRALSTIEEGRSEERMASTEQKVDFRASIDLLIENRDQIMTAELTREKKEQILSMLQVVRVACAEYLSEEQYVEFFGSDKL